MLKENIDKAIRKFNEAIGFTGQVYSFAYGQIPTDEEISDGIVNVGHVSFQDLSHVKAYRNELGWAFFIRIEAVLDALANKLKISKPETKNLVEESNLLCKTEKHEYFSALELRNILQHGDGDPKSLRKSIEFYKLSDGLEPEIEYEYVLRILELFCKVAKILVDYRHKNPVA